MIIPILENKWKRERGSIQPIKRERVRGRELNLVTKFLMPIKGLQHHLPSFFLSHLKNIQRENIQEREREREENNFERKREGETEQEEEEARRRLRKP